MYIQNVVFTVSCRKWLPITLFLSEEMGNDYVRNNELYLKSNY